ncbi:MAG: NlpC/P60 family protein [Enterococcus sp.]
MVKYNKIVSLMAIGTLFGPTLLSSQQVLAEETSTVGSNTVATANKVDSQVADETTVSSETPAPTYQFKVNDKAIENNYVDEYGNTIAIQYDAAKGSSEGSAIHYIVTPSTDKAVHLKSVKFVSQSDNKVLAENSNITAAVNGDFSMPDSDVSIVIEASKNATDNSSNGESTDTSNSNSSNSSSESSNSSNSSTGNNNSSSGTNNSSNSSTGNSTTGSSNNSSTNSNASTNNQNANNSTEVQGPSAARQPANDSTASDVRVPSNQNVPTFSNDVQTAIVQEAYRHLGKPYVWGAKGPNAFDCSGLAYFVYANATGHNIGGWTGDQQYAGTQIPVSEAQPGDLLFWGAPTSVTTHVAIYIGNGQYIHAPQPGDVVKIGNISDFTPTFAVRVSVAGLSQATASSSLSNAFGEYSTDTPFIFNKNQSTDQFIKKIGETAREIGQKNNVYSSVMIAQAILESGSGNSSLASEPNYNLFGIKGKYKGQGVTFQTLEQDEVGANYQISAEFRKYPSYKESLEDYAKLIKNGISGNSDFYKAAWKNQTSSYEEATKHLQGRYATDKQYAEKLNAIIKAYDLTEFDQAKNSSATTLKATKGPVIKSMKTSFDSYDRIQAKLIASVITSYRIPQIMSAKHFVNLFRGDSLIALAATATPKISNSDSSLPKTASIYVALSNGLLAVIPPLNE